MAAYHRPIELADVRRTLEELRVLMDGEAGPLLRKLKEVVVEYAGAHHGSALDSPLADETVELQTPSTQH